MKILHTFAIVVLVAFGAAFAQESGDPMLFQQDALDWQDGPPSLPAGVQFAVLEGVPSEEGPFTMRLRFPADYEIPAHTHPAIEHVTVLSGTFNVGMGEELDRSDGTTLTAGGFVAFPVGHAHYVWIEEETVVQLHGIGPWGIDYVDPANDPRN